MDTLASLTERIKAATSDKIIEKLLATESRHHFNHGFKTGCLCSVCKNRREYARLQALPTCLQESYRAVGGWWFDVREYRRELQKGFKKRVLRGLSHGVAG